MANNKIYHKTVLLNEAIEGLNIHPEGLYVDATFGGGGHSKAILERLGKNGKLIAFDQDADAWQNAPEDERLIRITENFKYIRRFLRLHEITEVDGILADLGVSSHQIDTADRGFSIRFSGPLDMRMDKRQELTAATILNGYPEQNLLKIFEEYGEVRNAKQLAKHIATQREQIKVTTTEGLKALLMPLMKGNSNKYLAQVFQSLRIEVNDELGALQEFLTQSAMSLKKGGRLCVISFHSLEDRIVKHYMKKGSFLVDADNRTAVFKPLTAKPIEPSFEEIKKNPRSESAKLRIAEKL